jgi:hypothetical protein
MPTEISNVYIFVPLSSDENHFFLSSGFVEENNLPDFIEITKRIDLLVIVTKKNNTDWFNHFWNTKIEENKVQSFFGSSLTEIETIFISILKVNKRFFSLIKFNFTILLKDLMQINSFIDDIRSNVDFVWKNFEKYDGLIHQNKSEWVFTDFKLLNELFYEGYSKSCYLILNEEQKDSDYYIINQSFRTQQNLLLIEFEKDEFSSINKLRIRIIRQTQNHSWYFFAENIVETLNDFSLYLFDNYSNWEKEYDEIFAMKIEDYNTLSEIVKNIDNKYRYIFIDEDYFIKKNSEIQFSQIDNSLWKEKNIFGLIIRKHHYLNRSSDFGSDNDFITAFGNSKYPLLRDSTPIEVWHYPRGFSTDQSEYFHDYYFMDTNIYKHFYNNKKYVLINFDEIPYIDSLYFQGCIIDNVEKLTMIKSIRLPKFLLEDTFVLTTDFYK